ncbi:hypothetical protein P171DRAFT_468597, partial [Karstenula rhodostoma CBS 690.94]
RPAPGHLSLPACYLLLPTHPKHAVFRVRISIYKQTNSQSINHTQPHQPTPTTTHAHHHDSSPHHAALPHRLVPLQPPHRPTTGLQTLPRAPALHQNLGHHRPAGDAIHLRLLCRGLVHCDAAVRVCAGAGGRAAAAGVCGVFWRRVCGAVVCGVVGGEGGGEVEGGC